MSTVKVTLGEHEVDVFPQRHAYLTNKLGKYLQALAEGDLEINQVAEVIAFFGDQTYDLLCVVIPTYGKRCPRYEFMGFASQEAMTSGQYDEEQDRSPSFPEVVEAFKAAAEVNRFDTLQAITRVIDPKPIKAWLNVQIAMALQRSANSLSLEGGSAASTSSGTTDPTLEGNGDSPSGGSSTSQQPTPPNAPGNLES